MFPQLTWAQDFGLGAKPLLAWKVRLADAFLVLLLTASQRHPLARFTAHWMIVVLLQIL